MPVKGTDGQMISNIHVAKNQNIIIGIANCNRDPRVWGSDATEWKPQRWLEPLPQSVVEAHVPGILPNV
jgi:cytochrome P450